MQLDVMDGKTVSSPARPAGTLHCDWAAAAAPFQQVKLGTGGLVGATVGVGVVTRVVGGVAGGVTVGVTSGV
jgi:hypothetical protein